MTAGPAAIAAAFKKFRRSSSSAIRPPGSIILHRWPSRTWADMGGGGISSGADGFRKGGGMKRGLVFGALAGALLLIGQSEESRVYVDFQEVMIPMRDGV